MISEYFKIISHFYIWLIQMQWKKQLNAKRRKKDHALFYVYPYSLPLVWSDEPALIPTSWPVGGSGKWDTGGLGAAAGGVTGLPSTSVV